MSVNDLSVEEMAQVNEDSIAATGGQKKKIKSSAKATAVRLLARREHSAYEISKKLSEREFDESEINIALQELKQGGWLSDERYAEAYIRMRQLKGFGPMKIRLELNERGVDEGIVEQYLDSNDEHWRALLVAQYEKKYRNKKISDYADKAKRVRFLQYRGFSLETIMRVVK